MSSRGSEARRGVVVGALLRKRPGRIAKMAGIYFDEGAYAEAPLHLQPLFVSFFAYERDVHGRFS